MRPQPESTDRLLLNHRRANITGTSMPFIAFLLALLGEGVAGAAHEAEQRPVRMTLQSVNLTKGPWQTDYWQAVVFVVTNSGAKPVLLKSCGLSTNLPGPLGLFGTCAVPPFTNSTLTVLWKPGKVGTQCFRYAVFEHPDVLWKTATSARALRDEALGRQQLRSGWLTNLWSTDGWLGAYEITSPPFNIFPEPLSPPDEVRLPAWVRSTNGWIRAEEIEPLFPAGEASSEWPGGLDWISDVMTPGEPVSPQGTRAANGSGPIPAETNRTSSAAGFRR